MTSLLLLPTEATLLDALAAALTGAGAYNKNDLAPPAAILWPDEERQWEKLVPALRERLPLLTLGAYDPAARTGPAIWIRCQIARTIEEDRFPENVIPIIYLPGVSRAHLRAVEECPPALQPLAELQYRGVLWTHRNGRDWTVAAFFQNADGGLGIAVDGDARTRDALGRALSILANQPLSALRRQQPVRADLLDLLLNPDEALRLLRWLEDAGSERARLSTEEWESFCSVCVRRYGFHPEKDGPLSAARRLGERKGAWAAVWNRFAEGAEDYPRIQELLTQAQPPRTLSLFDEPSPWPGKDDPRSSWPGINREQEQSVGDRLKALGAMTPNEARAATLELERLHGARREWIWAKLGRSPLARALEALVELATLTGDPLPGSTVHDLATAYAEGGWRVDAAAIEALGAVEEAEPVDLQAVQAALSALYRPWLEETAQRFHQIVTDGETGKGYTVAPLPEAEGGTCLLFCDGLRYDIGQRLAAALIARGMTTETGWRLAALPCVTSTAKYAVTPVADLLEGGAGLVPRVAGQKRAVTVTVLRQLLTDAGYQVLRGDELGDPSGRAWTELGAIDEYGHNHGWRVAYHAIAEVRTLQQRIAALLAHGWRRVVVVTDHGWLMLPEGLPKVELPEHLTEVRKGRCARLKPGAETELAHVPWYWDATVRMAVAPGIGCFEAGRPYEHGGLSLQECVVPVITVRQGDADATPVGIVSTSWRGLRCNVRLAGSTDVMLVDLRGRPGDAATSIAVTAKTPDPDGTLALFVENELLVGTDAYVVVLDDAGNILAQVVTTVGG